MNRLTGSLSAPGELRGEIIPAGPPGKSAYAYAVEGGYAGSEEEFYKALAGVGAGIPGQTFAAQVTQEDWQKAGRRFRCSVEASRHQLGYRVAAKEVLRQDAQGNYGNIWIGYQVLPGGDVDFYSQEPFTGSIVIEKL